MPPSMAVRSFSLPSFLAPAFAETCTAALSNTRRALSTSPCLSSRLVSREKNKKRGVSAMRGTGTRIPLVSEKLYKELPKPVSEKEREQMWHKQFPINKDHGLYAFFNEKRDIVLPGDQEGAHGRAWSYEELVIKDFADLHRLFWACIKERNRVLTRQMEFKRLHLGYGAYELKERIRTISRTMASIKHVLRDRAYMIEEAKLLLDRNELSHLLPEGFESTEDLVEDEHLPEVEEASVADAAPSPSTQSSQKPPQPQS